MLKLEMSAREPFWLDAPQLGEGVRFLLAPITPAMVLAARSAGSSALVATVGDGGRADRGHEPADLEGQGEAAFTRSIVMAGLRGWEGIGDADGQPVEPTREAVEVLLGRWHVFNFLDRNYVNAGLAAPSEKNGSSPSRNGTSGAKMRARNTARPARKSAKPARTG